MESVQPIKKRKSNLPLQLLEKYLSSLFTAQAKGVGVPASGSQGTFADTLGTWLRSTQKSKDWHFTPNKIYTGHVCNTLKCLDKLAVTW